MHNFELILISNETFSEGDIPFIKWALANGLNRFHLRKKSSTQEEINNLLLLLTEAEQRSTSVHYHHKLQESLRTKVGLHHSLNFYQDAPSSEQLDPPISSFSIHQWSEIDQLPSSCNYHFISPIFPSISKAGYHNPSLRDNGIPNEYKSKKNIALGGVLPHHIAELKTSGFSGAAVLGAIWNSPAKQKVLEEFFNACHK